MSKRKANAEFAWERNIKYDIQLLTEICEMNPYNSKDESHTWDVIVENLVEHPMQMKVTASSCRKRAAELLKTYRRNKRSNLQTAGGLNEREALLLTLATEVSKLEEDKPGKDRGNGDGEATTEKLLKDAGSESEKDTLNESIESSDDFDFGPVKKGSGKKSKSDVVKYLEAKSNGEFSMRKEELRVREEELKIRKEEIEVQRIRAEAEAEQSKAMMNLLMKLVNPSAKE